MTYLDETRFINAMEQQIVVFNDAIECFKMMDEFGKTWDGKVVNKRFVTALNNAYPKLSDKGFVSLSDLKIGISIKNRCRIYGDQSVVYVDYCAFLLDSFDSYIDENSKRLNAEAFSKAIAKKIDEFNDDIADAKKAINNLETYKQTINSLNKQIEDVRDSLPNCLRKYFSYYDRTIISK